MNIGIIAANRRRGGGGGGTFTIRGTSQAASSAGSVTIAWPTGTLAGDRVAIFATSAWPVNTPTGWSTILQEDGPNINGEVMTKVMTAGDITAGGVTITFGGSYGELAMAVAFIGAPAVRDAVYSRLGSSGGSYASSAKTQIGDYQIYFCGIRDGTASPSLSPGAVQETRSALPWGKMTGKVSSGNGAESLSITFDGPAYVAALTMDPAPPALTRVRGSRIAHVNNASSLVFTLPPGSVAGDTCAIMVGHGFSVSTPSGWTSIDTQSGANFNGSAFYKTLSSGDISTGSVTISFGGAYYGVVAGVSFTGAMTSKRYRSYSRTGSTFPAPIIVSDSAPVSGDYAIYFAAGRGNFAIRTGVGTELQTLSSTEASAVLAARVAGSGVDTCAFTYDGTANGAYCGTLIFEP